MVLLRRSRTATASDAVRITTKGENPHEDLGRRQRRYLVSMSIRTICFLAGVAVLTSGGSPWLGWSLLGASLLLPYFAVVAANSITPPAPARDLPDHHQYQRELM